MITKKLEDLHEHAKFALEDREKQIEANIGAIHSFFCARSIGENVFDLKSKTLTMKKA